MTLLVLLTMYAFQTHDLTLKVNQGDLWRYREKIRLDISYNMKPEGFKMNVERVYSLRVKQIRDDGNVEFVYSLESSLAEGEKGALSYFDFGSLIDVPIVFVCEPGSKVVSVLQPENLEENQMSSFRLFKQILQNQYTGWPRKPLAMGEKWRMKNPMAYDSLDGDMDMVADTAYRLEKIEKMEDRKCMVISYKGTFKGDLEQGDLGSSDGTMEGSFFLDANTRQVVKLAGKMEQVAISHGPGGEMRMSFVCHISLDMIEEHREKASL